MAETYVVLGTTSGIGRQVAEQLAAQGAIVHAMSRRDEQADGPPNLIPARCVVSEDAPTFPRIEEPLDGLAYLPGTINLKPFHLLRRKDFLQDLEVNYLGAIKTLQHYPPQLRKAENASVVLMSTVAVQTDLLSMPRLRGPRVRWKA